MKIAIDVREWKVGGAGKSRYVAEVMLALFELKTTDTFYLLVQQKPDFKLPTNFEFIELPKLSYFHLKSLFKKLKIEVFFSPTSFLMAIFSNVPTVIVVHDLAVFLEKRAKPSLKTKLIEKLTLRLALKKAQKVIAVSNNTRQDILKYYHVDPHKVITVWPAAALIKNGTKVNVLAKYKLKPQYILYVGTIEPRKNIKGLIQAFANLSPEIRQKTSLVLAGKRGWNMDNLDQLIIDNKVQENVVETGFIPDEDLPSLYQRAILFAYPSWYEGFGLPVVEAMSYGAPVITSKTSSLPEAAGEAGILVDPNNIFQLTQAMNNVLSDSSLRNRMIKLGKDQAQKFSWAETAQQIYNIIRDVKGDNE